MTTKELYTKLSEENYIFWKYYNEFTKQPENNACYEGLTACVATLFSVGKINYKEYDEIMEDIFHNHYEALYKEIDEKYDTSAYIPK